MSTTPTAGDLVAFDGAPGPAWLDVVGAVWASGAALLPVDHRLPPAARARLLARARPTAAASTRGFERLDGRPVPEETALVVATSGTRAEPKLATLTRAGVTGALHASAARIGPAALEGWLSCLPLGHIGGLLVVLRGAVLGIPVHFCEPADVEAFAAPAAPCTAIVPTIAARLVDAGVALDGFDAILVGGASLPDGVRARAGDAPLIETYGLTESCGGVVYDGEPLEGIEVRIGDGGAIEIRGTPVMSGYLDDPEATASALSTDGWLRTRDAGEIAGGRLRVRGRLDDVIVTGGEKVWPADVEALIAADPAVAEVAVVGRPDPEWGRRVVAFVVPRGDAEPALEDLRARVSGPLPRYAAPAELVIVTSLPRTVSGKVRHADLRHF